MLHRHHTRTGTIGVRTSPVQPPPDDPPTSALCVSGGGSRALTGALGQFAGLASLPDPTGECASMLECFDHLSSVSGGSWASVIYTYAPTSIGDDSLLITPVDPAQLRLDGHHEATPENVAWIDPHCIGTAPQQFAGIHIARALWKMFEWRLFNHPDRWRWFWIIAVGELMLRPFDLYDAHYDRRKNHPEPRRFFGSNEQWVADAVEPTNPHLGIRDFDLMRPGRAPLLVNMNIIEDLHAENAVQIPVQVGPEWGGAPGLSVDGTVGGGIVQSFGFTSDLLGPAPADAADVAASDAAASDAADVEFLRRYCLADIAGCSSAFFAAFILQYLNDELDHIKAEVDKIAEAVLGKTLGDAAVNALFSHLTVFLDADAADLIPEYNVWQPGGVDADPVVNTSRGFSDGGDFDNTGVLGALARTGATKLVSLVNASDAIRRHPDSGEVIVPGQVALLFGYQATVDDQGHWQSYDGFDPTEPLSYVQVFCDADDEFRTLREALFAASAGGDAHGTPWQATTWARQKTLTTIDNPVAGIAAGRTVDILWLLNERVDQWQDQISDAGLIDALASGQQGQSPDVHDPVGHGDGALAHFPWYSTAGQIHLDPEGVNMLAQLSAWNVRQLADELADLLG